MDDKKLDVIYSPENLNRDQFIYLINLSDRSYRYEDMLKYFESMIKKYGNLNKNERMLFEKPIKQIIQSRQKKLNKLYNLEKEARTVLEENLTKILQEEKKVHEQEIRFTCKRVLDLIDFYIMKNITDKETEIFLYRIKGDLYKYLFQIEEDSDQYLEIANNNFREALFIASKSYDIYNLTYLNTVISYTKFLTNFMKKDEEAYKILNSIISINKVKDILEGEITVDEELLSIFNEIKNMLNSIKIEV